MQPMLKAKLRRELPMLRRSGSAKRRGGFLRPLTLLQAGIAATIAIAATSTLVLVIMVRPAFLHNRVLDSTIATTIMMCGNVQACQCGMHIHSLLTSC